MRTSIVWTSLAALTVSVSVAIAQQSTTEQSGTEQSGTAQSGTPAAAPEKPAMKIILKNAPPAAQTEVRKDTPNASPSKASKAAPTEAATAPAAAPAKAAAPAASMEKLAAHYVEGPGYVTFFFKQTKGYAGTHAECETNCLADSKCQMIEFYKPLRKCHLYNHTKWSGKSGDADVALKKPAKSASVATPPAK